MLTANQHSCGLTKIRDHVRQDKSYSELHSRIQTIEEQFQHLTAKMDALIYMNMNLNATLLQQNYHVSSRPAMEGVVKGDEQEAYSAS